MKSSLMALILGLSLDACASHPTTAVTPPGAFSGLQLRLVELPPSPGPGRDKKEVQILIDQPSLKLASIVLRSGTALPVHDSAATVHIVALHGAGSVVVGGERLRIDPTHSVLLAPKVPHSVEPDPGTDLTLLVYHAGDRSHAQENHP